MKEKLARTILNPVFYAVYKFNLFVTSYRLQTTLFYAELESLQRQHKWTKCEQYILSHLIAVLLLGRGGLNKYMKTLSIIMSLAKDGNT
jgi:hypothetical protein